MSIVVSARARCLAAACCWVLTWGWHLVSTAKSPTEADFQKALGKATEWLARFPEKELRHDAAVVLARIKKRFHHPALERAWERAFAMAARDEADPLGRLIGTRFIPEMKAVQGWIPPAAGEPRINTNRPLIEALWCDRHPLRKETLAYITGRMRDSGGYHTTHALWALLLARENGCLTPEEFLQLAGPLRAELTRAQPKKLPSSAADVDLFAERLLFLVLSGPAPRAGRWARMLLERQNPDGSFGRSEAGKPPYHCYHATVMSAWALAEWLSRSEEKRDGG